ncbi:MAG: hypothetical protein B7X41_12925, partial [Microbacterium sp. 14-71-5]
QINLEYGDVANQAQADQQGWNTADRVSGWAGLVITDHTGAKSKPLGSVEVRQALNYAFDGAAVLKAVGNGAGVATNQVFPDGGDVNDPSLNKTYAYDVAKAKELLAKAGGAPNFDQWKPGGLVSVGPFLTALVAFLILAFVVYFFIVKPYEAAKRRFVRKEEVDATPDEDTLLLREIRDALVRGGEGPARV